MVNSDDAEAKWVVREVRNAVSGVSATVRPDSTLDGRYFIEFVDPNEFVVEVLVAQESTIGKVIVGRYVFDIVQLVDIPELVSRLMKRDFTLNTSGILRRWLRLAVPTSAEVYEAYGSRSMGELDDWEATMLAAR